METTNKQKKSLYSRALRAVVFPPLDFITSTHTRQYLKEIETYERYNSAELQMLQQKRLKQLVKHAYNTVPYYRQELRKRNLSLEDIKSSEDLLKLPLLTRSQLREQYETLCSQAYPKNRRIYSQSGGSTGQPVRFYTTRENREINTAARYLSWKWAGFEQGDKFAHVVGSPLDRPFFKSLEGQLEGKLKRRIYLDAFRMTEETLAEFADKMVRFKPEAVYGYAKSVALLARFIEDRGIGEIKLRCAIVDSEGLFEHEVKTVERVFGCQLWWNYHNRENGIFAASCEEHDGFHLFTPNHVVEFVRDGELVNPGEAGSIVVTDLTNYAMPFIRYETGDLGVFSSEVCACGRAFPIMKKLVGRTSEVLVSTTGKFMFGDLFHHYMGFFDKMNVEQYQIIQEKLEKITVKVVPTANYKTSDTETIKNEIRSLMGEVDVEVNLVDKIPTSNSGKVQAVIRNFPIKFT